MARDIKFGWDVDALNKAYRQGFVASVVRMGRERCPYRGQVVIAAWEAGWEDGQVAVSEPESRFDSWIA